MPHRAHLGSLAFLVQAITHLLALRAWESHVQLAAPAVTTHSLQAKAPVVLVRVAPALRVVPALAAQHVRVRVVQVAQVAPVVHVRRVQEHLVQVLVDHVQHLALREQALRVVPQVSAAQEPRVAVVAETRPAPLVLSVRVELVAEVRPASRSVQNAKNSNNAVLQASAVQ